MCKFAAGQRQEPGVCGFGAQALSGAPQSTVAERACAQWENPTEFCIVKYTHYMYLNAELVHLTH